VEAALADTTAQGAAPDDVAAMIVDAIRSDNRWLPLQSPRPPILWTDERSDVFSVLR